MSEQYLISGNTLTDIADAIREQSGESGAILAGDFADKIRELEGGSGDAIMDAQGKTIYPSIAEFDYNFNEFYTIQTLDGAFDVSNESYVGPIIIGENTKLKSSIFDTCNCIVAYANGQLLGDGTIYLGQWYTRDGSTLSYDYLTSNNFSGYVAVGDEEYILPFVSISNLGSGCYAYFADSSALVEIANCGDFTVDDLNEGIYFDPSGSLMGQGYSDVTVYVQISLGVIS